MANRSRISNIKVDDQRTEQILREIKRQLDNFFAVEDIEFLDSANGVILRDELGNRWRITINSLGNLIQTQL